MTTPTLHIIGKLRSYKKILFTLSRITNNWLGAEETMSYRSFRFIFDYARFFIFYTEQNRIIKNLWHYFAKKRLSFRKKLKHFQMVWQCNVSKASEITPQKPRFLSSILTNTTQSKRTN